MPTVPTIEERAFAAWPAEEVEEVDGWRLRATRGVTRRANSVWPGATHGPLTPAARIARAEDFYRTRALPAIFQISPATWPPGLDGLLAARGYRREAPVSVQIADARGWAARDGAIATRLDAEPGADWLDISCRQGRFAAVEGVYRALLTRIGRRAVFALATLDGQPAAVGLGVVEGGWCGVFSMHTLGAQRRKGLACAILAALGRHARERGVDRLYLQVERDNAPAAALYARFGFAELYGYHYRVRAAV
jgi:ribosomal protein S18 acetylase RimI-like enzyme